MKTKLNVFRMVFLLPILAIASCGALDDVSETRKQVEKSNWNMESMERKQSFATAIELMLNAESESVQVRYAQAAFVLAEMVQNDLGEPIDDPLYEIIGAPAPIMLSSFETNDIDGNPMKVRNVSIVSEGPGTENIAVVSPKLYRILNKASLRILDKLAKAMRSQNQDREMLRSRATRAIYVASTVLGAAPSISLADVQEAQNMNLNRFFVAMPIVLAPEGQTFDSKELMMSARVRATKVRSWAATKMRELHAALQLEDLISTENLKAQIEIKLNE